MIPLLIIGGLFVLYEFLTMRNAGGAAGVPGVGPAGASAAPAQPPIIQGGHPVTAPTFSFMPATDLGPGIGSTLIGSSVSVGTSGAVVAAVGLAGTTLGSAIPIVGTVFSAIFSSLMAASAKRAAQARNENSAVANEVPQWDAGISQIVNAYNAGQITAAEASQLLASPQSRLQGINNYPNGPLWNAYWNVVGPQIQPGRNGCQSGTVAHPGTASFCSGAYGAACCVGYDDLDNGQYYVTAAIAHAEMQPGSPVTSQMIPTVYASKYGGVNRAGYTVTVRKLV